MATGGLVTQCNLRTPWPTAIYHSVQCCSWTCQMVLIYLHWFTYFNRRFKHVMEPHLDRLIYTTWFTSEKHGDCPVHTFNQRIGSGPIGWLFIIYQSPMNALFLQGQFLFTCSVPGPSQIPSCHPKLEMDLDFGGGAVEVLLWWSLGIHQSNRSCGCPPNRGMFSIFYRAAGIDLQPSSQYPIIKTPRWIILKSHLHPVRRKIPILGSSTSRKRATGGQCSFTAAVHCLVAERQRIPFSCTVHRHQAIRPE